MNFVDFDKLKYQTMTGVPNLRKMKNRKYKKSGIFYLITSKFFWVLLYTTYKHARISNKKNYVTMLIRMTCIYKLQTPESFHIRSEFDFLR
jgi:hypothetical protein